MFDRRHPLGWLFLLLAVAVSPGPPPGTTAVSEVQYRGLGRALARVTNPVSIAAEQRVPMTASGDRCGRQRRPHPYLR